MMHATHIHPLTMAVVAITLALSAGCEKKTTTTQTPSGATTSTTTVTTAPGAERALDKAGDALADGAITTKVKAAMLADADVKGLRIDVDTRNGIVTLTGAVHDAQNIERAATLARSVDGVKSVDNRLTAQAPR